ncbi:uncharacterized protein LOC131637224 isoform X2 [Vicia villosa]|uniref:uncharacterized protein LOC131637224 isoform X2 n=1 Tax=Vicia villosa TaxID=3911 RepID=UPI00273BC0AF|nr:uncharacterized protein LOC131637224 isoform X2 [Vicia villosa]
MAKGVISDDEDEVEVEMDEREPVDGEELEEGGRDMDEDDVDEEEEGRWKQSEISMRRVLHPSCSILVLLHHEPESHFLLGTHQRH